MATKDKLKAIRSRIAAERDELEAEILRTEERLNALKMLKAVRDEEQSDIGAAIDSIS